MDCFKPEVSYKYTLTDSQLKEAVKHYINSKKGVVGSIHNMTMIPEYTNGDFSSISIIIKES